MLLDQPGGTSFDLNFRIFRVPVRVHPLFWLVTIFFGFDLIGRGIQYLLLWVVCVFVSILLHELGHVWMGHAFGSRGHILLQGLGGLAIGASAVYGRWRRIAVYLAGPGIQFLLAGLLLSALYVYDLQYPDPMKLRFREIVDHASEHLDVGDRIMIFLGLLTSQPGWPPLAQAAVKFLISINLWWAIINLVPVWPLDGGQVARELFVWRDAQRGVRNSLALSVAAALVLSINSLSAAMHGPRIPYVPVGGVWTIFLFGGLAFYSFMMLQMENARVRSGYRDPEDEERLPWERDPDEWKQG